MKKAFLFALIAVSAGAQANLVSNGDFEATAFPVGYYNSMTSLPGWNVLGTETAGIGVGYLSAPSQEIDLSGAYDAAGNGISQDISTINGQAYTLKFDIFTGGSYGYQGGVDAYIAGNQYGSNMQSNSFDTSRKSITMPFVATGSLTELKFMNNHGIVSHIDNVSVEAVPEPSTWMGLGLAVVGFVAKRRKK